MTRSRHEVCLASGPMQSQLQMQCCAVSRGTRCEIYPASSPGVTLLRALLLGLALTLAMTLFLVPTAEGCPRCAVGQAARAQVWSDDFITHLAIAVTPFALIGAICIGAEKIGRRTHEVET